VSDMPAISRNLPSLNTGSAPSPTPGQASEEELKNTPAGRKLLKAAREFEANLLSSWWEEAEKDLQDPLGGELGSGFDGLKGMAMNTMAMSMVKAGGVGISRMIFRSLEPALRRKLQEQTGPIDPGHDGQNQASQTSVSKTGG
jgi:hypothetical protein